MKIFASLLVATLFLPSISLAKTLSAGFPTGSLWISKTTVVAGETVHISSVVYNSSSSTLRGTVLFKVDGSTVGTTKFDLKAGETEVQSVSWKVTPGSHKLSAMIEGADSDLPLARDTTESIEITTEAPTPTLLQSGIETTLNAASAVTSNPTIQNAGQAIFNTTESIREKGLSYLQNLSKETENNPPTQQEESSSDGKSVLDKTASTIKSTWSSFVKAAVPLMVKVFESRALFYPIFCAVLLGLLYRIGKMLSRPRY